MGNFYKRLLWRRREGTGPGRATWIRWLHWQQWLALFAMGGLMIVIEIHDHSRMWIEHRSGQTFWTDAELIREVVFSGLLFPILGGVALGYLGKAAMERDEMASQLEMRRSLLRQMQGAESRQELADLLVKIPAAAGPAEEAWLLVQWTKDEEFDLAAHWNRPGALRSPLVKLVAPALCEQCEIPQEFKGARLGKCAADDAASGQARSSRHCLWLSINGSGKAALLWDRPADNSGDERQLKVVADLADEMSLSIENARLHYVDQAKGEAAMRERLRIARDLHDTLGQNVTFLRLKLEQLFAEASAVGHAEFQGEFARILGVADEAYDQVRDTLEELRSTERVNLEEALRLYGEQASQRAGFAFDVRSTGETGTLSARQCRQILYIAREAVNNVERHAAAHLAELLLEWHETELKITLRDDGSGFRLDDAGGVGEYGISIMKERSQAIRGDLAITTAPGEGTEVTLRVPLAVGARAG